MNKNQFKSVLAELKRELKTALKDKMSGLILFGSYARGEQLQDSDIDCLLILKSPLSKDEEKKVSRISAKISLKYDTVIVCLDYLESEFAAKSTPLLLNVRKEGIRV